MHLFHELFMLFLGPLAALGTHILGQLNMSIAGFSLFLRNFVVFQKVGLFSRKIKARIQVMDVLRFNTFTSLGNIEIVWVFPVYTTNLVSRGVTASLIVVNIYIL